MWFFKKKAAPYNLSAPKWSGGSPLTYTLFDGTRVSDSKEFSVFELKPDSSPLQQALAANAVKMWRIFRHPAVSTFIDSYEYEGSTYVVTEKIIPFDASALSESELTWAIYVMADFVAFLDNEKEKPVHGNILEESLFMTHGHELKIAGLHWMTFTSLEGPINEYYNDWCRCVKQAMPEPVDGAPSYAIDIRFVAHFIELWEDKLPKVFSKFAKRWMMNTKKIPSPKMFLDLDYWKTDKFMLTILFLRDLPLKDQFDRENFLKNLLDTINIFSIETQEYTILPILISSLSFSQSSSILENILAIGKNMNQESYGKIIIPSILPLFESKDRSIRVHLLSQIDKLIPFFTPKIINDTIFQNIIIGLNDSVVALKAATIIAMVPLAPHLSVNNGKTLLRELKRLQSDQDSSIRCNSVVCLAKIADSIEQEFRIPTLIQCFAKATTDSFGPTRKAAISAYKMCSNYFNQEIIAKSIMPALSPLCVDPNMEIRASAIKSMKDYIEKLSQDVPDESEFEKPETLEQEKPVVSKPIQQQQQRANIPSRNNIQTNAKNTASDDINFSDEDDEDNDWGKVKNVNSSFNRQPSRKTKQPRSGKGLAIKNAKQDAYSSGQVDNNEVDPDDDAWGDIKSVKTPPRSAQKVVVTHDGWSDDDDIFDEVGNDISLQNSSNQQISQNVSNSPVKQINGISPNRSSPSTSFARKKDDDYRLKKDNNANMLPAHSKNLSQQKPKQAQISFSKATEDELEADDDWGPPKDIIIRKNNPKVSMRTSSHETTHQAPHPSNKTVRAKKVIVTKASTGWDDDIDWDEED